MQRAAIKKQFFLNTFNFARAADAFSEGALSIALATSLADPLLATGQTAKLWLDVNFSVPLVTSQASSTTEQGTQLIEVRFMLAWQHDCLECCSGSA